MPPNGAGSTVANRQVALSALDTLRQRCPWPTLKRALRLEGLPIGQGWIDIEDALAKDDGDAASLSAFLPEFHNKYLTGGERSIQIYAFSGKEVSSFLRQVRKLDVSTSTFSSVYPLPISLSALPSSPTIPTLVEIRDLASNVLALVFCSQRAYQDRNVYKPEDLTDSVRKMFSEYDELIGVKNVIFQAFDVVVFHGALERIELRLDRPNKLSLQEQAAAFDKLVTATLGHLPTAHSILERSTVANLFPAISGIYETKKEGIIVDLGFLTHTGSLKREKMRKRKEDLRGETFHKAGKLAIHKITPFDLTVRWPDEKLKGKIELTLPGSVRDLSRLPPYLDYAIVSNCMTELEIDSIIRKLVTYLE